MGECGFQQKSHSHLLLFIQSHVTNSCTFKGSFFIISGNSYPDLFYDLKDQKSVLVKSPFHESP